MIDRSRAVHTAGSIDAFWHLITGQNARAEGRTASRTKQPRYSTGLGQVGQGECGTRHRLTISNWQCLVILTIAYKVLRLPRLGVLSPLGAPSNGRPASQDSRQATIPRTGVPAHDTGAMGRAEYWHSACRAHGILHVRMRVSSLRPVWGRHKADWAPVVEYQGVVFLLSRDTFFTNKELEKVYMQVWAIGRLYSIHAIHQRRVGARSPDGLVGQRVRIPPWVGETARAHPTLSFWVRFPSGGPRDKRTWVLRHQPHVH
jgi:hypothetical protein